MVVAPKPEEQKVTFLDLGLIVNYVEGRSREARLLRRMGEKAVDDILSRLNGVRALLILEPENVDLEKTVWC